MPHRKPSIHAARGLALAAAFVFTSLSADAALVARSLDADPSTAEAFFDTTLGITWMRDTTALHTAHGLAPTADYVSVITALSSFNTNPAHNFGFNGWRLPAATGVHSIGGAGCQFGSNGSTDCGENVATTSSELASMFHDTLGNVSWRDSSGVARAGAAGTDWGLVHSGDFDGLDLVGYWSGTTSFRLIFGVPLNGQVVFDMRNGTQSIASTTSTTSANLRAAWLVHDGDIGSAVTAAVPLPGSLALALLGLVLLARRRAI